MTTSIVQDSIYIVEKPAMKTIKQAAHHQLPQVKTQPPLYFSDNGASIRSYRWDTPWVARQRKQWP